MDKIVLVTSIAPKNISVQQKAVQSWIECGFQVVSCNNKKEIQEIEDKFPAVEFVEIKRDAQQEIGKPCPYIYDMLQILKEKMNKIGGIINSDIHFRNFTKEMYGFLYTEAQNAVIFMRRQDVSDWEDMDQLHSNMYLGGIDFFLFNKEMIDRVPDDNMILGQIMWDYWLPIILNRQGVVFKEFMNPVIFHMEHPIQWNAGDVDAIAQMLCKKYFPQNAGEDAVFTIKNKYWELMSDTERQLCYVTEEMRRRKVVVRTPEFFTLENQSHQGILFINDNKEITQEYDYCLILPHNVIPNCVMIDLAIWIVEVYGWETIQLYVHWRGNLSNRILAENCNYVMQRAFNKDISAIRFMRNGDSTHVESHVCNVYTCSVLMEEEVDRIWDMYGVMGRIYLYPAGYMAQNWVKRLGLLEQKLTIKGFVDRSFIMQGRVVCGYQVYGPSVLVSDEEYDKVVIISNTYTEEIYKSLLEMIPSEKIIIWNEYDGKAWEENECIRRKSC